MPKKTNKTSHVLNLLSGSSGEPEAEKEREEPASKEKDNSAEKETNAAAPAAAPQAVKNEEPVRAASDDLTADVREYEKRMEHAGNVHVIHAAAPDADPVAEVVRESLQEELEREYGAEQGSAEAAEIEDTDAAGLTEEGSESAKAAAEQVSIELAETAPEAVKQLSAEPVQQQQSEAELKTEQQPEAEPVQSQEAAQTPETPEVQPQTAEDVKLEQVCEAEADHGPMRHSHDSEVVEDDYVFINVMEKIVKEKTLSYMEQFGNCTCKRCYADTVALALTNLPPKYIVSKQSSISPLLNFYSDHFAGQVIVEITKACIVVGRAPRHDRE